MKRLFSCYLSKVPSLNCQDIIAITRHQLGVSGSEVSGFTDPEDGSRELVLTFSVGLSLAERLELRDRVGTSVDEWVANRGW
jgi:hypothetical protein